MTRQTNQGFNLYRFAMGWDWQAYRPEYEWFMLDNILSGKDKRWNELSAKNPSLPKIINHVQSEYQDYVDKFAERYNVNPNRVSDFYSMYVGYHPAYGAYMVGIGPYVGDKPEDQQNKFGYFTLRYPSTDSRNVITLWNKNLMGHKTYKAITDYLGLDRLNDVVSPEDFTLTVRQKVTPEKGKAGEVYEVVDMTPQFLEENDYQKAIEEGREPSLRPVMGIGSYFSIKPSGVFKLLLRVAAKDPQQEQMLRKIIGETAKRRGIPEDQILNAAKTDYEFSADVANQFAQINPMVNGITDSRRAGSQRSEALKPSREQTQMIKLMREISEIAVQKNSEDPTVIAQALNAKRPAKKGKAQGMFTPEIVSHWLQQIRFFREKHDANGNIESVKNYNEMLKEFDENLVEMRQGFDDMETALKIASLRFAEVQSSEIDPLTRAKMVMIPSMFEMPTNVNMTSQDLTEMRFGKGIPSQNQEETIIDKNKVVQPEQTEDTIDDIEVERPSVKTPPQPVEEEELEEEEDATLARTLGALKILAIDLRRQGKSKSAWGIERVIKKYQGKTEL